MKIVADANIPYAKDAFGTLGDVVLLPGRTITNADVRDADLLLVRSVTPVNAALLEKSAIRFVGSATIGLDHVDQDNLRERKIAFAYAPGSNANSAAEYLVSALMALGLRHWSGRTVWIIGLGLIGILVQQKARALGMTVLANDPPLERSGGTGFVPLEALLAESDIVTCHVPLTREGPDATYHLLNADTFSKMRPGAVVVNTSRGAVVDNRALLGTLRKRRLGGAILDVWENEPDPDPALIEVVTLGTPHIAGYSLDGKVNGTVLLYEAACKFLGLTPAWAPPVSPERTVVHAADESPDEVPRIVLGAYDIRRDDAALRNIGLLPSPQRGEAFDAFRAAYPRRLEFRNTIVRMPSSAGKLGGVLAGLGFQIER